MLLLTLCFVILLCEIKPEALSLYVMTVCDNKCMNEYMSAFLGLEPLSSVITYIL